MPRRRFRSVPGTRTPFDRAAMLSYNPPRRTVPVARRARGGDIHPSLFTLVLPATATVTSPQYNPAQQAATLAALWSIDGLGSAALGALYDAFYHDLTKVWDADLDTLRRVLHDAKIPGEQAVAGRIKYARAEAEERGAKAMEEWGRRGIRLLVESDPQFPPQLRGLAGCPAWVFVQGAVELLHRTAAVGIVGTRDPSPQGVRATKELTQHLCALGFVIVSGLAEGIDTAAHRATLAAGGATVAVLGNGINIDFPASNRELRQHIVNAGGAVVTEYFPPQTYSRQTFVQRNRIIAGLSSALFPVESRAASGTAHTVRFAQEYGRPVFAVDSSAAPIQHNEIWAVLTRRGAPCVDVGQAAARETLAALLAPFAADARPADPEAVLVTRYASVLKAFRDTLTLHAPDDQALEWLTAQIRRLAQDARPSDGS